MYIYGFDSLPNQVTTRRTRYGLSFNVLVVGPTGIGKTSLINSLFDFDYGDAPDLDRSIKDVELKVKEYRPPNNTIAMRFTVIETKGFNNQLDKSTSYKPILKYILEKYDEYLTNELKVQETNYNDISDNRVHCCIYMISPIGPGLKSIDIVTMKQLHQRVCLIPVIAKSDVLTKHERSAFKERVRQEIIKNGIEIYSSEQLPIAVAASNDVIGEKKRERVRAYPWGKMYVEKDSEFSCLKDLALRSNMLSLIEKTNREHYEKYRAEALSKQCYTEKPPLPRPIDKLEKKRILSFPLRDLH